MCFGLDNLKQPDDVWVVDHAHDSGLLDGPLLATRSGNVAAADDLDCDLHPGCSVDSQLDRREGTASNGLDDVVAGLEYRLAHLDSTEQKTSPI